MFSKKVKLNDIKDIKEFQSKVVKFEEDVDIMKGRYVVDAKSLLGIFTISLSDPFDLAIHTDDSNRAAEFFEQFTSIIVEE